MSALDPAGPYGSGSDAALSVTGPALVAGRRLGGRYTLDRLLARGGMAEVWEGHDEILRRPVAVKILKHDLAADASFVERFRREAVTAARLAHHTIVATFDAGIDAGTAYIVMELIRGRTLRQVLTSTGPLDPALAISVAMQIADALAYAHRSGLVHRDVKPANVLLCDDEGSPPQVKVMDFGIAKTTAELDQDLTATGTVLGTPKYFSPEQVEGRNEPDARSDLYALGVVLFEMLTGRVPFDGPTEMATALAHLRDTPPSVTALRPGVPVAVDDLVQRLLSKDPGDRPPTAVATRQALELLARDLAAARANGRASSRAGTPSGPFAAGPAGGRMGRPADPLRAPSLNGHVGAGGWTARRSTNAPRQVRTARPPEPQPSPPSTRSPVTRGTPPTGTRSGLPPGPPGPRPARPRQRRNSRAPALLVAGLVIAALVAGGVLLDRGRSPHGPRPTISGRLKVTSATVWMDNFRSPDNPNEAYLAIDGKTSTAWSTEPYNCATGRATFCGLYSGEGLAFELRGPRAVVSLKVVSPTRGWAASTYVSNTKPPTGDNVSSWGPPTASKSDIDRDTTFTLGGRRGQWILLWLTNIGPQGMASISEVTVS